MVVFLLSYPCSLSCRPTISELHSTLFFKMFTCFPLIFDLLIYSTYFIWHYIVFLDCSANILYFFIPAPPPENNTLNNYISKMFLHHDFTLKRNTECSIFTQQKWGTTFFLANWRRRFIVKFQLKGMGAMDAF